MNYFLIIFIPSFLYLVDDKLKTKTKFFYKTAILFLIIFTGLRTNFGADFATYESAYYRIRDGVFTDNFELGFFAINYIFAAFNLPFNFLLFFISIFNYSILFYVIDRNKFPYKFLIIFLYLIYFDLFFYSLSAIRQSIVISLFLLASIFIETKSFIKFLSLILLGILFHWSAILLLPFYNFYYILKRKSFLRLAIFYFFSIIFYLVLLELLDMFKFIFDDRIFYYLFIIDQETSYPIFYVFMIVLISIIWISFSKFNYSIFNNSNLKSISFPIFAIIIFLILKSFQFIHYFSVIPRLQLYFYPFYIFAIPELIKRLKLWIKTYSYPIIIIFMVGFFVFSYFEIISNGNEYYNSFRLINLF